MSRQTLEVFPSGRDDGWGAAAYMNVNDLVPESD